MPIHCTGSMGESLPTTLKGVGRLNPIPLIIINFIIPCGCENFAFKNACASINPSGFVMIVSLFRLPLDGGREHTGNGCAPYHLRPAHRNR